MIYKLEELPDDATAVDILESIDAANNRVEITKRDNAVDEDRYIATVSTGSGATFLCNFAFGDRPAIALREAAQAFLSRPMGPSPAANAAAE